MRKEFLLLLTVGIFISSILFKSSKESKATEMKGLIATKQQKISNIKQLKSSWKNKKIKNKLNLIKNYIPKESLKKWSVKKNRRVKATFISLSPNIYNRLMKDIWNTKIEIVKFSSKVLDEKYEVTLECKWQ